MKPGEHFEQLCYEYLKKTYRTNKTDFQREGGMDSTQSDIAVIKNGKIDFYIEVKDTSAQSGQFVLLPDNDKKKFVFSPRNRSKQNEMTDIIISYMNGDFQRFNNAGTSGESIKIDTKVFIDWIVEHYKNKNVKYIISHGKDFVILPIRKFGQYFDVAANYRIKKSGSSNLAKKDISCVKKMIQECYPLTKFVQEGKKLFAEIVGDIYSDKFKLENYTYYLSKQDKERYEVRKLSNTYNMNVIFSIKLIKPQEANDLEEFKSEI